MQVLSKQRALANLRARIESIEQRPALAGHGEVQTEAEDESLLSVPGGLLHEIYADAHRDAGAALGFALGMARGQVNAARPAVLYLQLGPDAQETGFPYGAALGSFGLDPQSVVFIRPQTIVELLWAVEEALACRAVAAVVADVAFSHKALDFTASRRLAMRSAASGASIYLLAYGAERQASAARLRWRVQGEVSRPPPFDPRAPGPSRWVLTLEKGGLGRRRRASPEGDVFVVDWTQNGFVLADDKGRDRTGAETRRAVSRAQSAALGDRLSQTG